MQIITASFTSLVSMLAWGLATVFFWFDEEEAYTSFQLLLEYMWAAYRKLISYPQL